MNNMNELLEKVTQFLRDEAKTETLIGKQFQLGEYTCVPVIALGMGFGGGAATHRSARIYRALIETPSGRRLLT